MESSSWPENLPSNRRQAIEELVTGREYTIRLGNLLQNGSTVDQDLVSKIMSSFTNTISILKNDGGGDFDFDQVSQVTQLSSPSCHWDDTTTTTTTTTRRKFEDSGESSKSTSSHVRDRRGSYKRRKHCSDTFSKDTPALIDDGHAWRKYGQKVILNSKHSRNYFRCTHKHDQGCLATKQVQKIEDDPPLYRTIYNGHHTCRNLQKGSDSDHHQLIIDSPTTTTDPSPMMISFGTTTTITTSNNITTTTTEVKQNKNDNTILSQYQSFSSDYLDQLSTFEPSGQFSMLSSDHGGGDVISGANSSCTTSTHSFDMDSIDYCFDDVLEFIL